MMNFDLISVIIPYFNAGEYIERALISIKRQKLLKYPQLTFEVIIIDDASDFENKVRLSEIISNYPEILVLINDENLGPSETRNIGIRKATGDLITFLDSDDEWTGSRTELLLDELRTGERDVVGGKIEYIIKQNVISHILLDDENRLNHVHLGALLVKRTVFDDDLLFDPLFRYSEDVDWWMRLWDKRKNIVLIEEPTLYYHIHGNNMTTDIITNKTYLLKALLKSSKTRRTPILPMMRNFRIFMEGQRISIIRFKPFKSGVDSIKLDLLVNPSYEVISVDEEDNLNSCIDIVSGDYVIFTNGEMDLNIYSELYTLIKVSPYANWMVKDGVSEKEKFIIFRKHVLISKKFNDDAKSYNHVIEFWSDLKASGIEGVFV